MSDSLNVQNYLLNSLLRKIALRIFIIILFTSTLSWWQLKNSKIDRKFDFIEDYSELRVQSEKHLFQNAIFDVNLMKENIENLLSRDISNNLLKHNISMFDQYIKQDQDKAYRSIKERFDHKTHPGVFITENSKLDNLDKSNILQIWKILKETSPVWSKTYFNTWVVYNGNTSITIVPKKPNTIYETDPKFIDANESYYTITNLDQNPKVEGKWTEIYYDNMFHSWMISYTRAIIKNKQKIGSIGVDIYLDELFQRVINHKLNGSYNFIISDDGHIILHPKYINEVKKENGKINIKNIKDYELNSIYEKINGKLNSNKINILKDHVNKNAIAVGKIPETNWNLVTVYTKEYFEGTDKEIFVVIFCLSLIYIIIELVILYFTLKTNLTQPLQEIIKKIKDIRKQSEPIQFPIDKNDEIGKLARSFNSLQRVFSSRHRKLKDYNENLEKLVHERTSRLEKILSESQTALERSIKSAKLATLGEVATGLAHELNSPLMVIKGTSHQLIKEFQNKTLTLDRLEHLYNRLSGTTDKMAETINNLRIFSGNSIDEDFKIHKINDIFKICLSISLEKLKNHQINFIIFPNPIPEIYLNCKQSQLAHAILNLINNSFESIINRPEKWIKILISSDGESIKIRIIDSGPKIANDIADNIFTPYFSTKLGHNHTGLGLSISQKMIEEHNGKLYFDKNETFNTFVIELRLHHASEL